MPLTKDALAPYRVVVVSEQTLAHQLAVDELTHELGACFIAADTFGLFASVFCDFGESFSVSDPTGEPPVQGLIGTITTEPGAQEGFTRLQVTVAEETRHGLETGDHVTFHELKGPLAALNECAALPVKVLGPFSFVVETAGLAMEAAFVAGSGAFEQVKQLTTLSFMRLRDSLGNPEFLISDFAKMDRMPQLHAGVQALHAFRAAHGQLPRPRNLEDAETMLQEAKRILPTDMEADSSLIRELAFQARGALSPMTTFIGGFVAQEVLKGCSGKFTPLRQHLYFDSLESLPTGPLAPTEAGCQPIGSRYDAQRAVFGAAFQESIANQHIFVVGAGAIGCELLKVMAMLGLGTGPQGAIHVTDMDNIEKSNLNRQFLFRPRDVGKPKSRTAAEAISLLNPEMEGHLISHTERVGMETEAQFGDAFFEPLSFVANALDNVEARRYVDRRCVFYEKALLESGTLGTKGNTQVVIPHLTESYSSSQDPPERMVPVCTLHHFPNTIEHTIEWAMDAFHGAFRLDLENVNRYLSEPDTFVEALRSGTGGQAERVEALVRNLVTDRPSSFEQCIAWARLRFESLFANNIKQLLYNFPRDYKTRSGEPFWSGPKRAPTPLVFDPQNALHMGFVVATANLRAENFGLKGTRDTAVFHRVLDTVIVPDFVPRQGVKIETSEGASSSTDSPSASKATSPTKVDDELEDLLQALPEPRSLTGVRVTPIEFEKDDDTNFHIDWVSAAANLRAGNYEIASADRHKIKGIAGKIIPAIATTTALVAGLVGLEALKVIDGANTIERYKNGFANLALPFFAFSEPIAAPKTVYGEAKWTLWDRFDLPDMTLAELLEHFRTQHGLEITMLNYGPSMLFGFIRQKDKLAERMAMRLSELVVHVSKKPLPPHATSIVLDILAEDEEGNDVEAPFIKLKLN